jgi:hypothetical protein
MAAVAERLASASRPDTAAEQDVAIPVLRQLALQAILALGFNADDAECILEVQCAHHRWHDTIAGDEVDPQRDGNGEASVPTTSSSA